LLEPFLGVCTLFSAQFFACCVYVQTVIDVTTMIDICRSAAESQRGAPGCPSLRPLHAVNADRDLDAIQCDAHWKRCNFLII